MSIIGAIVLTIMALASLTMLAYAVAFVLRGTVDWLVERIDKWRRSRMSHRDQVLIAHLNIEALESEMGMEWNDDD
jgi:hypothetical protein